MKNLIYWLIGGGVVVGGVVWAVKASAKTPAGAPQMTGAFSVTKGLTYRLMIQNVAAAITADDITRDLIAQGWSPASAPAVVSNQPPIFTMNATWNAPTGQANRLVSPRLNIINMTLAG